MNTPPENTLELIQDRINSLRKARETLSNVLLGQGHIVKCQGVHLTFDVVNGVVNNPAACAPERCRRFCLEDAQAVARNVKNGADVAGEAVHVKVAVDESLQAYEDLLGRLMGSSPGIDPPEAQERPQRG